jgi:hypothetical protein
MNCRESRPLLPLFLDGELDARQMREVALHSTRCGECEQDLRGMERLQELISSRVQAEIAQVDLSRVWAGVAPRLVSVRRPWYESVRERWEEIGPRWQTLVPVSAAAAVAGLLAMLLWQGQQTGTQPTQWASASDDNSAIFETVQSGGDPFTVIQEPETKTTVLWINASGEGP